MKKLLILSIAAMSMVACTSTGSNVAVKTSLDSLSNAVGTLMGDQFKQMFKGVELNPQIIAQAIENQMKGKNSEQAVQEADEFLKYYMTVVLPAKKEEAGAKFLEETAKKSGVQKTDSGLLYEITEAGDAGMKPVVTDTVVANYKGTTIDGTEFDSSYARGEAAAFPLSNVIKGWIEGLQLVGKGGKIKLYIPAELAYGKQGQHNLSGEVLIFEVELMDVKKGPAAEAQPVL